MAPAGSTPRGSGGWSSAPAPTAASIRSSNTVSTAGRRRERPTSASCRSTIPPFVAPATTNEEIPLLLTHPTLDQMHRLGLAGMARAFTQLNADPHATELSHAEWLGLLLDREGTERQERRLQAR